MPIMERKCPSDSTDFKLGSKKKKLQAKPKKPEAGDQEARKLKPRRRKSGNQGNHDEGTWRKEAVE
jgi:hypothetical protein